MTVRSRHIIPGNKRLDNERKIAENIALRSNELRAVLSTIGKKHALICEKHVAELEALEKCTAQAKSELVRVHRLIAGAKDEEAKHTAKEHDLDRREREIELKTRDADCHISFQKQKLAEVERLRAETKRSIAAEHAALAEREVKVLSREETIRNAESRHLSAVKKYEAAVDKLIQHESSYSARVAALVTREERAATILDKETRLSKEEERIDAKGLLIQNLGKEQKRTRAGLARERARLGRIKHKIKE